MNQPIFDIDAMCSILKRQGIESSEYTDCTILYSVTFEQLRNLFTEGYQTGLVELLPLQRQIVAMSDLRYELLGIAADVDAGNGFDVVCRRTLQRVIDALGDTQATAEAYDREHAAKVLEELLDEADGSNWRSAAPVIMPNVMKLIRENAELTKLLAEAKSKAVPEDVARLDWLESTKSSLYTAWHSELTLATDDNTIGKTFKLVFDGWACGTITGEYDNARDAIDKAMLAAPQPETDRGSNEER